MRMKKWVRTVLCGEAEPKATWTQTAVGIVAQLARPILVALVVRMLTALGHRLLQQDPRADRPSDTQQPAAEAASSAEEGVPRF